MRKIKINYKTINDYLFFSFLPSYGNGKWPFEEHDLKKYASFPIKNDLDSLMIQGIEIFENVFDQLVNESKHKSHLVPLSAGLDSRLIIAALLDRIDPKNITAVTFGTPGTIEFEIPQKISRMTGINHKFIDATQVEFNFKKLVDAVNKGGAWTSTPDMWFNQEAMNVLGDEPVNRWSGFIGDYIAGSYAHKGSQAKNVYNAYAEYEKKCYSINLTHNNYVPTDSLIEPHIPTLFNLTDFELLALSNRIPSSSATICLHNDTSIISPLIHPEGVSFMFRVPHKYRVGCNLYNRIMLKRFPDLMKIPTKNSYGARLDSGFLKKGWFRLKKKTVEFKAAYKQDYRYAPVGVNYMYYSEAIRQKESLKKIISESCFSIDERKITPWISAKDILQEHLDRKKDHTRGLLILLGLEVNLRARNE